MGRVKLKIQKLENSSGRQSTYSKRKNGLTKKAKELAILCDIDILLLMFSPSGKPSLYKGQHSSIEKIIERYSLHTPQERERRKLESLEALKKTFKKVDHDVKIQDFLGPSYISVEDLRSQAESLQSRLSEVQKKLSDWSSVDTMDSIENLGQMESSLRKSLDQLQTHKVNLEKQQQMDIQYMSEFQDSLHQPFTLGIEEQLQPLPWVLNNHSQDMVSPNNLTSFPLREPDCSVGTSFQGYTDILNTGEKVGTAKNWQQDNVLAELNRALSLDTTNQFNRQVLEQQTYPSNNFDLLNYKGFVPVEQINMQENTLNSLPDRKLEVPQSASDPFLPNWASTTSGTCGTATFDEHFFPQFHFSSDDQVLKDLDYMLMKAAPHSSLIN